MKWSDIVAVWPSLEQDGRSTSPEDRTYNCIAWAAYDQQNWWQPLPIGGYYWPEKASRTHSSASYVEAYGALGFEPCDAADLEPGFEKIALYVDPFGAVTHAARQLPTGRWTSKLGESFDIEHATYRSVEGALYGVASQFLKRRLPA